MTLRVWQIISIRCVSTVPSRSFNEALSRAKLHPLYILSRYASLSLFCFNHPPTAIGRFPAYRLSPWLANPALDTYINLDPSVLGLLIPVDGGSTHLWNVGRQSFYKQYNPEDSSEHHTRRRENLKSHNWNSCMQHVKKKARSCESKLNLRRYKNYFYPVMWQLLKQQNAAGRSIWLA
jgi:hypothetical protein